MFIYRKVQINIITLHQHSFSKQNTVNQIVKYRRLGMIANVKCMNPSIGAKESSGSCHHDVSDNPRRPGCHRKTSYYFTTTPLPLKTILLHQFIFSPLLLSQLCKVLSPTSMFCVTYMTYTVNCYELKALREDKCNGQNKWSYWLCGRVQEQ